MKYPKINTLWKRDEKNKFNIMEGEYSDPEFANIKRWHITEKIDGTNIRIFWDGEKVRFGGRTDEAQIPTFLLNHLQDTFTPELMSSVFTDMDGIILFGEGYGPKIQKVGNRYRDDVAFILFDICIDETLWLRRESVEDIATKLGIESVPIIGLMTEEEAVEYVKQKRHSAIAKEEMVVEGIVARSYPLVLYRDGRPLMWKLKVKDYTRLERVTK